MFVQKTKQNQKKYSGSLYEPEIYIVFFFAFLKNFKIWNRLVVAGSPSVIKRQFQTWVT